MKEIYDEFRKAAPAAWMLDYIDHTRVPNGLLWIPKSLPMFIEFKRWKRHFPPSQAGLAQSKVLRMCNISMAGLPMRVIGRTVDDVLYMSVINNPYGPHKFVPYESMVHIVEGMK